MPELEKMGAIGPRANEDENLFYRYMVDIDGNSNAWSGYFLKLLTGSPTIKLKSKFRQWYYDRLEPNVHFFAIDDLEADLPAAIERMMADDEGAKAMGERARTIVETMTLDSEFPVFAAAFEKAARFQSW